MIYIWTGVQLHIYLTVDVIKNLLNHGPLLKFHWQLLSPFLRGGTRCKIRSVSPQEAALCYAQAYRSWNDHRINPTQLVLLPAPLPSAAPAANAAAVIC